VDYQLKSYKKVLIIVLLVTLVGSGIYVANNHIINYFSSPSSDPTVYIGNGVSGVVTITDPFLNKTTDFNITYSLDSGSGVIVTPDGYIITAFHVVGDPHALNTHNLKLMDDTTIKQYLEQEAVKEYLSKYNPQLGGELLNNVNLNIDTNVLTGLLVQKKLINVKSYGQVIKVYLRSSAGADSLNAQLVDVGDPTSHDDVALLKINSNALKSVKNLPNLSISSQNLTLGEDIRIYGYPDNEMQTQSLIPSITTGQLTAKMRNSFGTIYYLTNAPAAPGYSGGPVLNSQNNVIGIMVYGTGLIGEFNQQIESQNTLFLPSNYIIQICEKNNVSITVV